MEENNLKTKAKSGLVWSAVERFGTQGVQFFFGIILARLLSPSDYGIIAMPMVFLAIAQVFIDSGFTPALIRKPDLKEEDLSTAFYFNIGVGCFFYVILFICSPLIANFYETPILSDILKFTALATLLTPLTTVQRAILTKTINFKLQAKVSMLAALTSGTIGIWMAYSGFGIWSLVVQQVGAAFVRVVLFWIMVKWKPSTPWSKDSFNYLWGYGNKMLASGLLDTLYNNVFPLVIGKYYSAQALGNYTRAQHFSQLPSSNLTGILQRVSFPLLSAIQNDDVRLARNYRKILKMSAMLIFPLMLGLSAVADPFVRILLTDKWEGCILILQIMCFQLMLYPIHAINLNLLQVKGRSDLFFRLEIIKKIIGISIMIVTIPKGVIWMVCGLLVSSFIALVVNTYYTGKLINVGYLKQMGDLAPIFGVSFVMWLAIILLNNFIESRYIALSVDILIGVSLFYIGARIFLKDIVYDIAEILPIKVQKNIKKIF